MDKLDVRKDLGQMLLEEGAITEEQLRQARHTQLTQEKPIGRALMDMELITDEEKVRLLHVKFGYEVVDISGVSVAKDVLNLVTFTYAEKHRCVPILIEDGRLVMAMEDPTDILVLDEIQSLSGMKPLPVLAPLIDIEYVLEQYPRLTNAQAAAIRREEVGGPLWWRVAHPLCFLLLMISPLIVFGVTYRYELSDRFTKMVMSAMRESTFDVVLYLVAGWALWSILIWEIDGLAFRRGGDTRKT